MKFIPYGLQWIDERDIDEVVSVLKSDWITTGPRIKEFEDALKKKFKKDMKAIIKEVKVPELSAKIMGEFIASQLEARMPFRKVAKNVLQKVMEK